MALAGFATLRETTPLPLVVLACALAAIVEGSLVTAAQIRVLRRRVPAMRWRAWALATILPAFVAYLAGFLLLPALGERGLWIPLALVGLAMAALLGAGQWAALRRHARGTAWWIPASALGWTSGVSFVVLAISLAPDGAPAWAFAAAGVAGGAAMGLAVGLVTSFAFVRLRSEGSNRAPPVSTR